MTLTEYRKKAGYSQMDLAKRAHTSIQTIQRIEQDPDKIWKLNTETAIRIWETFYNYHKQDFKDFIEILYHCGHSEKIEKKEIEILKADRCTEEEAKKYIKKGTIILWSFRQYVEDSTEIGMYNGETIEDIRKGKIEDISAVTYKGHEYIIMYIR